MGNRVAPPSCTACMNSLPAMTNVSLLAKRMRLPAFAAAMAGCRPAAPTMAAMTISTSSCAATSLSACSPCNTVVLEPMTLSSWLNCAAASACNITANCGWYCTHKANKPDTLLLALKANKAKRWGCWEITSKVCMPMVPVAPNMVTCCMACMVSLSDMKLQISKQWEVYIEQGHWQGGHQSIYPIQYTAVARQQLAAVFNISMTFHQGFKQIPHHA